MTTEITDMMTTTLNRSLLRYAVQTTMFCDATGEVLDMKKAVMLDVTTGTGNKVSRVITAKHWDEYGESIAAGLAEHGMSVEILDGRQLWKRAPRKR